jgi:hypothetical protein
MKVKKEYENARYAVYSHRRSKEHPYKYMVSPVKVSPEYAYKYSIYDTDSIAAAMMYANI